MTRREFAAMLTGQSLTATGVAWTPDTARTVVIELGGATGWRKIVFRHGTDTVELSAAQIMEAVRGM